MKTKEQKKHTKIEALAKFLDADVDDLSESRHDESSFDHGREEYLVLTDGEADERAADYVRESIWAFRASFILSVCGLDGSGEEGLRTMQEKSCEGANDFLLSLVERTCGLEEFVRQAVQADGRGHFLSSYDGEENEEGDYFIYRVN